MAVGPDPEEHQYRQLWYELGRHLFRKFTMRYDTIPTTSSSSDEAVVVLVFLCERGGPEHNQEVRERGSWVVI